MQEVRLEITEKTRKKTLIKNTPKLTKTPPITKHIKPTGTGKGTHLNWNNKLLTPGAQEIASHQAFYSNANPGNKSTTVCQ